MVEGCPVNPGFLAQFNDTNFVQTSGFQQTQQSLLQHSFANGYTLRALPPSLGTAEKELQFVHMDEATTSVVVDLLGGGCYCLLQQWILEEIPKKPQEIAAIMCNVIRWPAYEDFHTGSQTDISGMKEEKRI